MNFSTMMENIILNENYGARRSAWGESENISMNIAGFVIFKSSYVFGYYHLSFKDYEANDWELINVS